MNNPYYPLLNYLNTYGPSTRSAIEHWGHGAYAQQIDECQHLNLITSIPHPQTGEILYEITADGKALLQ